MTLRHFRIFLAVCETLNMTRAARQLHISQPSVTQAIHEIETHYGLLLFERLGRHIFLTPAGENLKQYAYQILSLCQQAEDSMTAMQHQLPIRLGVSITIGDIFLVELLTHCRQIHPEWDILSAIHNTEELEQLLMEDKLDLALVEGRVHSPYLVSRPIITDYLTLIASPDSEWSRKAITAPQDLDGMPVFVREQGSGTRDLFERVLEDHHLTCRIIGVYNNSEAIKKAVMANLGVSVLSRRLVQNEIETGRIVELPLPGLEFKRQFRLVHHKNKYLTQPMQDLISICCHSDEWL